MTLAGVLNLVLLATLPRLLPGGFRKWNAPVWLVTLGGLAMTYTRGAWIGLGAGAAGLSVSGVSGSGAIPGKISRTEVPIARIQPRTLFEQEAHIAGRGPGVPEGPRTEFPVQMIHREVAARVETSPTFEQEHTHPRFGERHRGEASASPGTHDDRVEWFLLRDGHRWGLPAPGGGSA